MRAMARFDVASAGSANVAADAATTRSTSRRARVRVCMSASDQAQRRRFRSMARMPAARAYTDRLTAPVHYTTHWSRPRWMLAALLGGLGTIGPFAVDTYLPAFAGIASSLSASPLQMQQTLSAYLFGIALMNLFHGALSD